MKIPCLTGLCEIRGIINNLSYNQEKDGLPLGPNLNLAVVRIWKFVSLRSHAQSEAGPASNSAPSFFLDYLGIYLYFTV